MKHDSLIMGALPTKDERRILSWSGDNTLRLWDVATDLRIAAGSQSDAKALPRPGCNLQVSVISRLHT
jgi:WD40 repeat protein